MRKSPAARGAPVQATGHDGVADAAGDVRFPQTYLVMLATVGAWALGCSSFTLITVRGVTGSPGTHVRALRSLLVLARVDLRADDAVCTGAAAAAGDLPSPLARANASIGTGRGGAVCARPHDPRRDALIRPAPDWPSAGLHPTPAPEDPDTNRIRPAGRTDRLHGNLAHPRSCRSAQAQPYDYQE